MRDLFYYKREGVLGGKKHTFLDSFNLNKVVRTLHQMDGTAVVLLDDGHEESIEMPNQKNPKGEPTRKREYYYSQITLIPEDRIRLQKATCADEYMEDIPPVELPKPKEPEPEAEKAKEELVLEA